jgi:hypothetical protein
MHEEKLLLSLKKTYPTCRSKTQIQTTLTYVKNYLRKEKAEECRAKDAISPIKAGNSAKRNNFANRFQTTIESGSISDSKLTLSELTQMSRLAPRMTRIQYYEYNYAQHTYRTVAPVMPIT